MFQLDVNLIQSKLKEENINISHYDLRFVKPIDEDLLHKVFNKYKKIITIEDGSIIGGFGSSIIEFMIENKYNAEIIRLGIPDKFIGHGTQQELYKECSYDEDSIVQTVKKMW